MLDVHYRESEDRMKKKKGHADESTQPFIGKDPV